MSWNTVVSYIVGRLLILMGVENSGKTITCSSIKTKLLQGVKSESLNKCTPAFFLKKQYPMSLNHSNSKG